MSNPFTPDINKRLSASRIDKYLNCSEAYRRHYIDYDKSLPSPSMMFGNLFHHMAMVANKEKQKGKTPCVTDLSKVVEDNYDYEKHRGYHFKQKDIDEGNKDNVLLEQKTKVLALIPLFLEHNKDIDPLIVEEFQEIKLPTCNPIVVKQDVITRDGKIIDYKTGAKKKAQVDIDKNTGLTFYALAYRETCKKMPNEISFHNYVARITPKKKKLVTEFQHLTTKRTIDDFNVLLSIADEVVQAIEKKVFLPASTTSWYCSQAYCSYFNDCRFVNQSRLLETPEDVK